MVLSAPKYVPGDRFGSSTSRFVATRASRWAIWIVLVGAVVLGGQISPVFFTRSNLLTLLSQAAVLGIAAVGITFVMIAGELDVSIAGTVTVGAVLNAAIMNGDDSRIFLGVLVTILFGAAVGLINGILVAAGVQSFILTLAVGMSLLGAGQFFTGGSPIGVVPPEYVALFREKPLGLPVPAWALFACLIVAWIVQSRTRLGNRVYLVGGNRSSAHRSGVRVGGTIVGAFVISGVFAALAGLVLLGRNGLPNNFDGMNLHFQALAAVALGGTALSGGRGSVKGTLAGSLLIVVSLQIGVLLGWPFGAQLLEYGALIVIATVLYSLLRSTNTD